MKTAEDLSGKASPREGDVRRLKSLTKQLDRDDIKLGMPLLDAAVAGLVLGFRPSDREMRRQADRCWEELKPHLAQHLSNEDEVLLPHIEHMERFTPEVIERIKLSHRELHSLTRKLDGVSFEEDSDQSVGSAGKALVILAMKLDDTIDNEGLHMIPVLRRELFA